VLDNTQEFLSRLDGVVKTGNGWDARCPCRNDDHNPSLSIAERDGVVLVHCHRAGGCTVDQIASSVGMSIRDLMSKDQSREWNGSERNFSPQRPNGEPRKLNIAEPQKLKLVEKYNYVSEHGELLFQKVRFIKENGKKTFRQRKPDGHGGYSYKLDDTPKVLYNLPRVLKAKAKGETIIVVEGEKDADTLINMGLCATTMPGGAGKWLDIHTDALAGAVVDVIADNDEPGRLHALNVINELRKAGSDVQGWICPRTKDITDFLEDGGQMDELLKFDEHTIPPSSSESVAVENTEQLALDDQDDDADENFEEIFPTKADEMLAKIKTLIADGESSPLRALTQVSLLASSALSESITNDGRLVDWHQFVQENVDDSYDWLIPDLLERRERVIVVAAEGVGKTMLARQVAILPSWGVHPFTFERIKPITTLFVDLENPERIIRRTSRAIHGAAMSMNYSMTSHSHLLMKPDGLNLLSSIDRLYLETQLELIKPDLLVLGPLYKAFIDPGNKTSESVAIEVVKYLDTIRVAYGCALWLEHHAPLGESMTSRNLRPFGSAVWSRWPEFGLALQPDAMSVGEYVYDVRHFRGERDERRWPTKMKRGKKWPFEPLEFRTVKHER